MQKRLVPGDQEIRDVRLPTQKTEDSEPGDSVWPLQVCVGVGNGGAPRAPP